MQICVDGHTCKGCKSLHLTVNLVIRAREKAIGTMTKDIPISVIAVLKLEFFYCFRDDERSRQGNDYRRAVVRSIGQFTTLRGTSC